jgi:hypothetical protein
MVSPCLEDAHGGGAGAPSHCRRTVKVEDTLPTPVLRVIFPKMVMTSPLAEKASGSGDGDGTETTGPATRDVAAVI